MNDNAPVFDQHNYHASIVENLRLNPPAPILQVQAKDPDQDINGAIHYSILSGNDGGKVLNECLRITLVQKIFFYIFMG